MSAVSRWLSPRPLAAVGLSIALALGAVPATAADTSPAPAAAQVATAKTTVAKVKTTANLNMRQGSGTGHRVVLTIPKGRTLSVSGTAANGWYKVSYSGKTGWISNRYATVAATSTSTTSKPKAQKTAPKSTTRQVKLWVKATSTVNIRKGSSTRHAVVTRLSRGENARATSRAANGWYKVSVNGKTGWVSNKYVTTCSAGCEVDTGNYTTNRAGLTDRYFTKSSGADIYASVGGVLRIGDIPKNSIVYRDLKWEREAGQVAGWYFVRTQGTTGWMKAAALKRGSDAATRNSKGHTRSQVRKQRNGQVPASMLVAIPWDSEKTLIAAPALNDLTRLNAAFRKKFGKNLDIDLAYRTLDTQKYYYRELGPYIAAKPGTSNHGWGLAIDVPETHDYSFRGKYYKWLKANSHKYNWVHQKYLEEYRTNGSRNPYAEAWHFEYVGR